MTETLPARMGGASTSLPAVQGPPSPAEWRAMRDQAAVIVKSGMAPKSVNTPEKVLVIALKGRELALPIMQALSHVHVIEGKPTLSAECMAALVQRAGHRVRVLETTAEKCVVEGVRADDPEAPSRVEWNMEDAKRAGVLGKGPWKQYPAAMLRARAISALCRFAFPDVLMGASYTPEELGAEVEVGPAGEIVYHDASGGPADEVQGEVVEAREAESLTTEQFQELVRLCNALYEDKSDVMDGHEWFEEHRGWSLVDLPPDAAKRLIEQLRARLEEKEGANG